MNEDLSTDKYGFVMPVWKVPKSQRTVLETEIDDAIWSESRDKLGSIAPCDCEDGQFRPTCKARSWSGCRGQQEGDFLYQEAKYRAVYASVES